jgi:cell division protein FtsB
MAIATRTRRRITQILGPVFAASVVAYFAFYTVEGERGLIALSRLQAQEAQAETSYAAVKGNRDALQARVMSLRPDSLDVDRLDERTRTLLNDSRSDELIINLPNSAVSGH